MTRQARSRSVVLCGFLFCVVLSEAADAGDFDECVIMLHGLARSAASMEKLADAFEREGYAVANVDYPSRQYPVEVLAPLAIHSGLEQCADARTIHVVTHSLGGILVRYYLQENALENLGRVVMLAPPNNGSEVVDDYRGVPGYKVLNGPAGLQLGTDDESLVASLEPVSFELGVIAGTKTLQGADCG